MKERPIPFSAPMVRAILDGTKTQTRRALHPDLFISSSGAIVRMKAAAVAGVTGIAEAHCPYGQLGDRLWVREAWRAGRFYDQLAPSQLPRASGIRFEADKESWTAADQKRVGKLRPGMFMPRWASRITLEVTGVRVERLQDISEADAKAEGASFHDGHGVGHSGWRHDYGDVHASARSAYARLWEDINGPGSWAANPWVWVVEFRRI